ncbi:MAG: CoA transferase, partial [Dehalococcoidia bacterium]
MTDTLPLAGVRIVDFSWIIAGPTCTRILGLMGAEVLKVESSRRPDPTRAGGGASFHLLNQSKNSVSLNLSTERGLELAKKLISLSDVVIENFATGVIERLGLGYDVLKAVRPDLVMVSSSGLGHTGPDRGHVAYGTLLQCFTGW